MAASRKTPIVLGIEKLLTDRIGSLKGLRVGLICNQASVDHEFRHAADLFLDNKNIRLTTLFGPQHGIRGDVQDNMVETGHSVDRATNLPVYSLYSETREPTSKMLEDVDVLVFDLQDVGCRVYTFIYTMANAMRACSGFGKKLIVADRPNPIGGRSFEGNILDAGHESFVGQFPIPMRHGMSVGELAKLFNEEFAIGCELEIVAMDGWSREDFYDDTDGPWVMPSPNMPACQTAVVFPGTVYFEGTQVSEGRGTTRPFELIGAPFVDPREFRDALNSLELPGVIFRDINFVPTFQKHAGKSCGGVFVHVSDRQAFKPVITGLAMVAVLYRLYPKDFLWKAPPYEYELERNPFDVIDGSLQTRRMIETGAGISEMEAAWSSGLAEFSAIRDKYLMY